MCTEMVVPYTNSRLLNTSAWINCYFSLLTLQPFLHKNSRTPTVQKRENSNHKAGTASLWKRNKLHNKTKNKKKTFTILQHPVRPLGLKHFFTQKIPHPLCLSKKKFRSVEERKKFHQRIWRKEKFSICKKL